MQPAEAAPTTLNTHGGFEDLLVHESYVKRMARGLLRSSHDSEDVVQQTWLEVLSRQHEDIERPRSWLARVAWSRSIDLIRRQQVRRTWERSSTVPESVSPAQELADESVRQKVLEAVQRLSEPYLTAIQLRFYENLPPREIARRTGVPVETAHTRLRRAMIKLRSQLDREFGDRQQWTAALLPLAYSGPMPSVSSPKGTWKPFVFGSSILAGIALAWLGATGHGTAAYATERLESGPRVVMDDELLRTIENEILEDDATDKNLQWRGESRVTPNESWRQAPPTPWIERPDSSEAGAAAGRRVEESSSPRRRDRHAGWAPPSNTKRGRSTSARSATGSATDARASDLTPILETPMEAEVELIEPVEAIEETESVLAEVLAPRKLLVVDPLGFGEFTDLNQAVAAAGPDDAIILHPVEGGYPALQLWRQGIVIFGANGTRPLINGLLVKDLASDQAVVLRGLDIAGVDLRDDHGRIWIEHCTITATEGEALVARRSTSVSILRTAIRADGFSTDERPRAALLGLQSDLYLYDCLVIAPSGAAAEASREAATGGTAARVVGGSLYATNTLFQGGVGGEANLVHPYAGAGGIGLWSEGEVRANVCTLAPGAGGHGSSPGNEGIGSTGPIRFLPGAMRTYEVESPVRAFSKSVQLAMHGSPGDVVFSVIGVSPSDGYLALHLGSRLVHPPYALVNEGRLGSEGVLEKEISIPAAMMREAFGLVFLQGLFFATDGEAYLGSGSALLMLPQ